MAAPQGIDWEWAQRTGGALSPRQQRQLLVPLARTVMTYPAIRVRLATKRSGGLEPDLDAIDWPDSRLAREATEEARSTLPPFIVEHSFRTYLYGRLLAQVQGAKVDQEVVYVAAMLHDTQIEHPRADRCFAVTGGEHARQFALDRGADRPAAEAIGAAVAAHITVGALDDVSDPGGFVSGGAFADLTGVGLEHASARWVDAVLAAHPRHQARTRFLAVWNEEARTFKKGRARWLNRYAAFPLLMRLAPFAE